MKQHVWTTPFPRRRKRVSVDHYWSKKLHISLRSNKRPVFCHRFDKTLLHRVDPPRTVNRAAGVAILSLQLLKPLILPYYNTLCWQYIFIFVAQAVNSGYGSLCTNLCEGVYHSVEMRTELTSTVPMSNWEEDLVETLFSISFLFWF